MLLKRANVPLKIGRVIIANTLKYLVKGGCYGNWK